MSSLVQIHDAKPENRNWWRSLDELSRSPQFEQWVKDEFPGGLELVRTGSRRTVLKLMAAAFGMAGLTACRRPVENILPAARGVEDLIPGQPKFYCTAFALGGVAAGILVESHEYRPTKIEGNPQHPFSRGAASAFAQASVLELYDPDRMQRVSRRGESSSWSEFGQFIRQLAASWGEGSRLRILSGQVASPSLEAVRAALLARYPAARWVEFEPLHQDEILRGAQMAFGRPLQPHYRFDQAEVILSLDGDFLGADSLTVLPTRQFAEGRRVEANGGRMSRLYVAESNFTITGSMADHRLRVKASDAGRLILELARLLGLPVESLGSGLPERASRFLNATAKDLAAHRGRSVILAGPRQPAEVHAIAFALNHLLGNVGQTVSFTQPLSRASELGVDGLAELAREMAQGSVETLVILGGNPVYSAPADLEFGAALRKVAHPIHLTVERNETTLACEWQLPEAHYLESWGDVRAPDGTVSIQQPLIERLYDSRTASELIAQLADYRPRRAYEIVRGYWMAQPAVGGEERWRKALHDGVVEGTAFASIVPATDPGAVIKAAAPRLQSDTTGLEIVFFPSAAVYDGRFANNPWLQELPDPITKLVWDNAALISPQTARSLGVESGDVVRLSLQGRSINAAVLVTPGHADDSVSLTVGYGRSVCGRVGKGVGINVSPLRTSRAYFIATGASLAKTGRTHKLVTTQEHFRMEGRPIIREASLDHFGKHPDFARQMAEERKDTSLFPDWDYSQGHQWGMAIDLNACTGCNACIIACQAENNIPTVGKAQVERGREMHWIRLDRYFTGSEDEPESVVQPMACQQCETAPCESVCPVAATTHSPEGLNDMAYNRCIGTRYCSNNCPYKVRRFNYLNWHRDLVEIRKMVHNPDVTVRMRGVMEKCTYCVQRIQEKKIAAKAEGRAGQGQPRPLRDGEILTACQQTCPADAIVFGDLNDPESRVARIKRSTRNYEVLGELRTKPRTTYLAKLRNTNPELA